MSTTKKKQTKPTDGSERYVYKGRSEASKRAPQDYWERLFRSSAQKTPQQKATYERLSSQKVQDFPTDAHKKAYFHQTNDLFGYKNKDQIRTSQSPPAWENPAVTKAKEKIQPAASTYREKAQAEYVSKPFYSYDGTAASLENMKTEYGEANPAVAAINSYDMLFRNKYENMPILPFDEEAIKGKMLPLMKERKAQLEQEAYNIEYMWQLENENRPFDAPPVSPERLNDVSAMQMEIQKLNESIYLLEGQGYQGLDPRAYDAGSKGVISENALASRDSTAYEKATEALIEEERDVSEISEALSSEYEPFFQRAVAYSNGLPNEVAYNHYISSFEGAKGIYRARKRDGQDYASFYEENKEIPEVNAMPPDEYNYIDANYGEMLEAKPFITNAIFDYEKEQDRIIRVEGDALEAGARLAEYSAVDYSDIATMSFEEMEAEYEENNKKIEQANSEINILNYDGHKYSEAIQNLKFNVEVLEERQAALRSGLSGKGEIFAMETAGDLKRSPAMKENLTDDALAVIDFVTSNPNASFVDLLSWSNEFLLDDESGEKAELIKNMLENGTLIDGAYRERLPQESMNFLKALAVVSEKEEFADFMRANKKKLEEASAANVIAMANEYAKEHPVSASFISLLKRTTGSLESGWHVATSRIKKEEVSPNDPSQYRYEEAAEGQRTVSDEVIKSSLGRLFYNTGMGMGDFLIASVLGGKSSKAVGLIMGTKNFGATATELINEGMDTEQAVVLATGSALIETAIEAAGAERLFNFLNNGHNLRKLLVWFQAAMAEGTEEVFSEIGNDYYEKMIVGYSRESEARKKEYEKLYPEKSIEEIEDMAAMDTLMSLGLAFAGGFIAGGFLDAGALAVNAINVKTRSSQLQTQYPSVNKQGLTEIAKMEAGEQYNSAIIKETFKEMEVDIESRRHQDTRQVEVEAPVSIGTDPDGKEITGYKWVENDLAAVNQDGDYVPAEMMTYSNKDIQEVAETAAQVFKGNGEAMTAFVQNYTKTNLDPSTYSEAFASAVNQGRSQHAYSYKTAESTVYANALSPSVQQAAIEVGRNLRIEESKLAPGDYPVTAVEGQYGVIKEYTSQNISEDKMTEIGLLDTFAKKMKLQIAVTDTLGKSNGLYNTKTRQLVVALDAQDGGIIKAASHEAVHHVKTSDAGAFQVLEDFVVNLMGENGIDVGQRIAETQQQYRDKANVELSRADALEEIVADALPEVITNRKNIEAFVAQNEGAARRLLESIKRILKKLRDAFKGSKEHQIIKESVQTYEEAVSLFEGALRHVARMNDVEFKDGVSVVAASLKDDVKYSFVNNGITDNQKDNNKFSLKSDAGNEANDMYTGILGELYPSASISHHWRVEENGIKSGEFFRLETQSRNNPNRGVEFEATPESIAKIPAWADEHGYDIEEYRDRQGYYKATLTHRKTAEEMKRRQKAKEEKFAHAERGYVRFGDMPKSGYSRNRASGEREAGVSVFRAKITAEGDFDPVFESNQQLGSYMSLVFDDRPVYRVYGTEVGTGGDGEPVLSVDRFELLFDPNADDGVALEEAKKYNDKAKETFGTTNDFKKAAYVLLDGTMLDFSKGKKTKTIDSKSISKIFEGEKLVQSEGLIRFMNQGNVLLLPESFGIDISVMPTDEQLKTIGEYINSSKKGVSIDISNERGFRVETIEYPKHIKSKRIIEDIRQYFSEGKVPELSWDDNWRFSLKTTENADTETLIRENDKYRKAYESLKEQFKLSKEIKLNQQDVRRIAYDLVKENNSTINPAEVETDLSTLFAYVANNPNADMGDVTAAAGNIVKGVLRQSQAQVNMDSVEASKDLRSYLRKTPIALNDVQKAEVAKLYGSYGEFRKRHFGTVNLSDKGIALDSAWADLGAQMPGYFDADVSDGDMPVYLAEVLDNTRPQFENNLDMDIDEAASDIALDLLERFNDVRIEKTFADKQKEKRIAAVNREKEKYKQAKAEWRDSVSELKEAHRKEMSQTVREVRSKIRDRQERTAGRGVLRRDVERKMNKLSTDLRKNTDTRHIPYELRGVIEKALPALDFKTKLTKETRIKLITELQRELQAIESNKGIYRDGPLLDVYDSDIGNMVDNLLEWVKGAKTDEKGFITTLGRLEDIELKNVFDIVGSLHHMVTSYNKLFIAGRQMEISELAVEQLEFIRKMKGKRNLGELAAKMLNPLDEAFNYGFIDAQTFFYHFKDTPLEALFVDIQKSSEQGAFKLEQARIALRTALDTYGYKIKEGEKQRVTLGLESGKELVMSKEQAMYIHAANIREQYTGTRHLTKGGIVIESPNSTTETLKLTENDIRNISAMISENEKQYIDALMEFSRVTAEWGNETSLKLHGIEKFGDAPYITFKVHDNELENNHTNVKIDPEVKNMGITKSINKKAISALNAEEFTKVWSASVESMVTYSQLAIPLDNLKRFLNYKDYDNNQNHITTALSGKIGSKGITYIQNFRKTAAGALKSDQGSSLINKAMSMAKSAAIGANLRVAIQQPTSVFRALAEMDAQDLAYGMTKKGIRRKTYEEIKQYSALGIIKEMGRFDLNSRMNIYNDARGSTKERIQNFTGWLAQMGDELTFNTIWEGSKHYIERTTTMQKGSDAYWKAVTDYFENVITKTQVIDTVINRVPWANGNTMNYYTAFKSEPFKTYNLLRRAIVDIQNGDVRKGLRAVSSVMVSTVITAAMASIVSGWRDDKDEFKETYIDENGKKKTRIVRVRTYQDKWLEAFMGDLPENFISILPFAGDVYSAMQGYTSSRIETKGIESLVKFAKILFSDSATWEEKVRAGARAFSDLSGIPVYNVYRDGKGILNTIHNIVNEDMLKGTAYNETKPFMVRFEAAKRNIDPGKDAGFYYDLLAMIRMDGLSSEYDIVKNYLVSKGKTEQGIYTAVNQRLSNSNEEAREGAKAHLRGDLSIYEENIRKLTSKGIGEDAAISMVKYQENKIKSAESLAVEVAAEMKNGDEGNYEKGVEGIISYGYSRSEAEKLIDDKLSGIKTGKVKEPEVKAWEEKTQGRYTNQDLGMAIEQNNGADIARIIKDGQRVGKSDSSTKSGITSTIKPIYIDALESNDTGAMKNIVEGMSKTGLYVGKGKTAKDVTLGWATDYYYSNLYEQIDSGSLEGTRKNRDSIKKLLGSDSEAVKKMQTRIKNKYKGVILTGGQKQALTMVGFSLQDIDKWSK